MNSIYRTAMLRVAQAGVLLAFAALFIVAGQLASSAVTIKADAWESCEPGIVRWSIELHNPMQTLVPWKEQL